MKYAPSLHGIALTTITPFDEQYRIDEKGIHALVDFLLAHGVNRDTGFLVPLSTTGNFLALNQEEKKQTARACMKAVGSVVDVVIGCNSNNLSELTDLASFAADIGARGVMFSPPFYWKAREEQIIEFYRAAVEKNPDFPVIIYNNHWASQNDLSVSLLQQLAEIDEVIGIKESTHTIQKLVDACRTFRNRFLIFNGLGEAFEPMYTQLGCAGFTSTFGNAFPEAAVRLQNLLSKRSYDEAEKLSAAMAPCTTFLDSLSGGQYIAALKYVLDKKKVCGRGVRTPVIPLNKEQISKLEKFASDIDSLMYKD